MASTSQQGVRPTTSGQAVRLRSRLCYQNGSLRYIGRARTTTFGLVTSTVTDKNPTCFACHLPATVGWQGFRLISGHLLPTMDPILGPRNQRLIRIGQSGIMVLRLRVPIMADAEACRLQPRTRQNRPKRHRVHCEQLLFTLRRSRGAIKRYQGPTWALLMAPDVLRRPTDGSDGFPGGRKGLRCDGQGSSFTA